MEREHRDFFPGSIPHGVALFVDRLNSFFAQLPELAIELILKRFLVGPLKFCQPLVLTQAAVDDWFFRRRQRIQVNLQSNLFEKLPDQPFGGVKILDWLRILKVCLERFAIEGGQASHSDSFERPWIEREFGTL